MSFEQGTYQLHLVSARLVDRNVAVLEKLNLGIRAIVLYTSAKLDATT